MKHRIIMHVDMDAFFTSCEQRENPKLKGKPVIVGADPRGGRGRGVVSAASYEARKFGIHSAQPISIAWRKCNDQCVFLPVNFRLYEKVSANIMAILRKYADKFESWGIDEAYLDIGDQAKNFGEAKNLAIKIKKEILKKEKLTCSVGIGPNKLIAKIASDFKKPDGLIVVLPKKVLEFLSPLSVREIIGVGPKTEAKLNAYGIRTCGQLRRMPKKFLVEIFGKWGVNLYYAARGVDESEVIEGWERKSISAEHTFEKDTSDKKLIFKIIEKLSREVYLLLKKENFKCKIVMIKIRYAWFETHTKQVMLGKPTNKREEIASWAKELVKPFLKAKKKIRLIGVKVAGLEKIEN